MKHLCIALLAASTLAACTPSERTIEALSVDELAVEVTADENREYSYTDKRAGFWYGRTHQDTPTDWYAGWNQAKRRLLADYSLACGDTPLKRSEARVMVAPDCLTRTWDKAEECLQLVDNLPVVLIALETAEDTIAITLDETLLQTLTPDGNALLCTPKEAPEACIKLVPLVDTSVIITGNTLKAPAIANGFLLAYGKPIDCDALISQVRTNRDTLLAARKARMNTLIQQNNPLKTNLPELDRSLAWITLTMDQLITEQQGKGIYAGLPWFNEYWGRDMFIAMPGATLVTGQFDYTKEILKDFAKLQDTDPQSPTCGRIPNRANLEDILYNTTDGTPRYVIEAEELLNYSGDQSFLNDIYPSVVLSIDQSILNYIDEKGYLVHADADTWMDVKRNGIPGSPRGNRANDIQYLWYKQLLAGANLARLMNDQPHADTWTAIAQKLAQNFEADYCDKQNTLIYDHLNVDGTPDLQFRPNQLFCFDLIKDDTFKQKVTRRVWEELVYPWGVASLAQTDRQFHPQHENWHYYHKDDAYHNGTIWLWNNGIAMQRMIEYNQVETAWKLFCNMNRQALKEGAVGSLSENADAHPREGQTWVNRSGTFLQAWSNSEQLRVWYQHFLGIRPQLLDKRVIVEPKLPQAITHLETSVKIGQGTLTYKYKDGKYDIRLHGVDAQLEIILPETTASNPLFEGIDFCQPNPLESYPCFATYHKEALTY